MNSVLNINWSFLIILCLSLGLAPFSPPHIWEKLLMLFSGQLNQAIDIFDLLMHSTPWLLLGLKIFVTIRHKKTRI